MYAHMSINVGECVLRERNQPSRRSIIFIGREGNLSLQVDPTRGGWRGGLPLRLMAGPQWQAEEKREMLKDWTPTLRYPVRSLFRTDPWSKLTL